MKKLSIILLTLLLATAAVSTQEAEVSIGFGPQINVTNLVGNFAGSQGYQSTVYLGVDAFLDFTYGFISIGYSAQVGNPSYSGSLASWPAVNNHNGFLSLRAMGKYPIALRRGLVLFPMLGVEGAILVNSDNWGAMSEAMRRDATDIFLVAGVGVDISLGSQLYLRISNDLGVNLTAQPNDLSPGFPNGGYKLNGNVAIGFRL